MPFWQHGPGGPAEDDAYRRLFDEAPLPYHSLDADGHILAVNAAWLQMLGYEPKTVVGARFADLILPEFQAEFAESFRQLHETGLIRDCPLRLRRVDGIGLPVELCARVASPEAGQPGTSYCQLTGTTGKVSERTFRHLFENAPVAIWREDFSAVKIFIENLRRSGVTDFARHFRENPDDVMACIELIEVREVNRATLALHGAASYDELAARLRETFTPESLTVFRHELAALAEGQSGAEAMTVIKTLAGEPRQVMFRLLLEPNRPDWDSVYAVFTDLTESRRMEDMSARLATAIDQTGDSVFITDRDGAIQYCNPAFEAVTGYGRDEVLGRTPRFLKSGRHDISFYKELWATITSGNMWVGTFINRHKSGRLFVEDGSISPVFAADGSIVNFVSVKRDVTSHLDLERRLNQSQKMEAVGQLAGGIAHDFNNILHAMLGNLEFALEPGLDEAAMRREIEMLRGGVDRASALTRQLLAFSRRQVLELKNVDANDLIAQLLKMVRRVIGEDIELDFRPGTIRHEIHVDPGQIEQVLLNLCLNARDAMPEGGRLTLETDLEVVGDQFMEAHPWARAGTHVRIRVRDTGQGIDPEVLPQIFEPFFTTKERGRGTGLGLATVYGIIKQHEGVILVDSAPRQGTVFSLLLPASEVTEAAGAADQPRARTAPRGTETILLAEDDAAVRNVIGRILGQAGYRVLEAGDGQEALNLFDAHAEEIELALLDLVMPLVSGAEVAAVIRSRRPKLPILFNTGYSEDAIRGRIPLDIEAPLLMKPHDPVALLERIRQMLDSAASN